VDTPELNAIARRCRDYLNSGTTAMADQPLVIDASTYTDESFKSRLHPHSIFGRNEPSPINMHRAFREAIGRDPDEIVFNPQKRVVGLS